MGLLNSLRMLGQSVFSSRRENAVLTLQYFQIRSERPYLTMNQIIELMKKDYYVKQRHAILAAILATATDEEIEAAINELNSELAKLIKTQHP